MFSKNNGARRLKVEELLAWAEKYPIQWREPRLDLGELAKLRWIQGMTRKEIAERFGRTESGIQHYFERMNRLGSQTPGLTMGERRKIQWVLKK